MKYRAWTMIPLIILGVAACDGEEQTVTVTVATSEFVGWDDGTTRETGVETFTVTEGSEIEIEGGLDDLTLTVNEIRDDWIEVSFSMPMAPGTSGGGGSSIYGTTIYEGQGIDISTPTEDAVSIYRIDVDYEH